MTEAAATAPVPPEFATAAAVVVGGTGGVGLATARRFAEAGVRRIGLVGRNPERGAAAAETLRRRHPDLEVCFVAGDVNQPAVAQQLTDELAERLDGIDLLVNSTTGSANPALLHDIPIEAIPDIVNHQMLGPLLMSRAVLPLMREQRSGSIVNIASDAAKHPTPGETVIGAGMAAIVMFTRAMAMEAKRDGIRVNAITPSLITDSGGYERVMSEPFSARLFQKAARLAALGVAEPVDIAELACFLSSPAARRITGQVVSPNGRISA
ncbi:putative oxidoreductase [Gordonia paraffinivorans NBRC 108238]|uniref:Oxidoreductase n=1 Tax=Gordonia paraffinivorans NBRC 108238 TaxID=1223543 RepID=A0ABQ0ILP1_9ACTN|nr:SDR family oxidoreductase [Gordonia paraffinivorans]GAC84479.1 putative oxidoreductase [Gordonia paraffinivorans NBRC 108238]